MRAAVIVLCAGAALSALGVSAYAATTGAVPTVAQALDTARAAWRRHDADAVERINAALLLARAQSPLLIRQAVVVHAPHTGLGLYTPAPNDVVIGRDMQLYVEVANFASATAPDGATVTLEVDGTFSYLDGADTIALGPAVKLGSPQFFTRTPLGVTSFGLDFHLGDKAPAGEYRALLHVHDSVGNKDASKTVRFVLKELP